MLKTALGKGAHATVCEFGCNVGLNLHAATDLWPGSIIEGYEPNDTAREIASKRFNVRASIREDRRYHTVFTCGVLIHVPPGDLLETCTRIYDASVKRITIIEYFSPEPQEKLYRGRGGLLWTRDFGKFWLENFKVRHVANGFFWKPSTGLDNLTWWRFLK